MAEAPFLFCLCLFITEPIKTYRLNIRLAVESASSNKLL